MQDVVRILIAEKTWTGGAGFVVTDEMKVTVAAQASLLVLGFGRPYYYDALRSVVLYPRTYDNPNVTTGSFGVIPEEARTYGEMWPHGTVVLSWEEILACGHADGNGRNLVLHELAHYFDMLDRYADGVPFLAGSENRRTWERVVDAEFHRLAGSAERREETLLDQYGTWDKAEFFAIATECFFELPKAMRQQRSELYSVLQDLYRQDPAQWLPDARKLQGPLEPDLEDVDDDGPLELPDAGDADELLTAAFEAVNRDRFDLAINAATRLIALDPGEAEAHQVRARAFLELREYERSLADSEEALRLGLRDGVTYRLRGSALVALGRYKPALRDLRFVATTHGDDAEAYFLRGLARAGLGQLWRATGEFSRSIANHPFSAKAYFQRGLVLQRRGRHRRADVDFAKARQLDPRVSQESR